LPLYQVLVHSPFDYPEVSGKGLAVNYRKEVFVGVSAKYVERFFAKKSNKFLNPNYLKLSQLTKQ
jgi:hypothetical protein